MLIVSCWKSNRLSKHAVSQLNMIPSLSHSKFIGSVKANMTSTAVSTFLLPASSTSALQPFSVEDVLYSLGCEGFMNAAADCQADCRGRS